MADAAVRQSSYSSPSSPRISAPIQRPTGERSPWDPSRGTANGHADAAPPPAVARAAPPATREETPASIFPGGRHALAGTSIRAFGLGTALGVCVMTTILLAMQQSAQWRAPFLVAVLALFHFLEFYTTAAYNTPFATPDAFLLTSNGYAYNAAHSVALLETLAMHSPFLSYSRWIPDAAQPYLVGVGALLLLVGQATRSTAMVQAGTNFNHTVQQRKSQEHKLVTTGVYAVLRHPSYFGFFWWGLGSQLVLGNVVCFVGYAVVLWRFFSQRIKREEELLVQFFGAEYVKYRQRTVVGIPFIS